MAGLKRPPPPGFDGSNPPPWPDGLEGSKLPMPPAFDGSKLLLFPQLKVFPGLNMLPPFCDPPLEFDFWPPLTSNMKKPEIEID